VARTINPKEYAFKRNEILTATQKLVFTKGFEEIAVKDILKELQISSGAFHHYFVSRDELLGALIERIRDESEKPLRAIIDDENLSAVEKLEGFFATLASLRMGQGKRIARVMQTWYSDRNAVIRQKIDEATRELRIPMLTDIVSQGIAEGTFNTDYPELAGDIVLSILQGMGDSLNKLLLSLNRGSDMQASMARVASIDSACLDAIERVLGLPQKTFKRAEHKALKTWVSAFANR
jgi:AcrR family transcriptional regulator